MRRVFALAISLCIHTVFAENTVIAIVDNEVIPLSSLEEIISPDLSYKEKIIIIENHINLVLQIKKSKELGVFASETDLSSALVNIANENNITIEQFQNFPEFYIIKKEVLEKISILNLQRLVTKDLIISDEILLDYCNKNSTGKNVKQIRVAQIIISDIDTEDNIDKDITIKLFLNKLSNHIEKGALFDVLAKLHSQHPSYSKGGVSDWIFVDNSTIMMLDSLKSNEVSKVYPTDFGFAIAIKTDERYVSNNLEKCKENLIYSNAKKYYSNWIKKLRRNAYVEIYYDKI